MAREAKRGKKKEEEEDKKEENLAYLIEQLAARRAAERQNLSEAPTVAQSVIARCPCSSAARAPSPRGETTKPKIDKRLRAAACCASTDSVKRNDFKCT